MVSGFPQLRCRGNCLTICAGMSISRKNSTQIAGDPVDSITLHKKHLSVLTHESMKDEFISGIINLLQGEEPKATCSHMETVFYLLAHDQSSKVIPGIPKFDPTGMKQSELERYHHVQAGKVPSTGLDHSYIDLKFKPITTLEKEYLSKLYVDCLNRVNSQHGSADYRRFLSYLVEVMKYCADSGEL